MSRKHTSALLVALLLLGVFAVAAADGASPAAYDDSDDCFNAAPGWVVTPNDTNVVDGAIDRIGDVDYIELENYFAGGISVTWGPPAGLPFRGVLSLYDADANLLLERTCPGGGPCLDVAFTGADTYYLKVSSADRVGGQGYVYRLHIEAGDRTDFGEPNDALADATPIAYGERAWGSGYLSGCSDQDTYTFPGRSGDVIELYTSAARSQLLDAQGVILGSARAWTGLRLTLPADGIYFARILGECDFEYSFRLRFLEHEPNAALADATPVLYNVSAPGFLKPCDEVDTYTFSGGAGHEITIDKWGADLYLELLDAGGRTVAAGRSIHAVLPAAGRYFVRVTNNGNYCGEYSITVHRVDQPVYLSFDKAGQVGGIAFTPGDVLRYWRDDGRWEMALDQSAIGLNGNLSALLMRPEWYWDARMTFSLATAYQSEGVGKVLPQDMVTLEPLDDSASPRGCLTTYFDGSDVGLTTAAEQIDSAGGRSSAYYDGIAVYLSTAGRASLPYGPPALRAEDEDLVLFQPDSMGADTRGAWRPFFDGSAYGLAAADVIAADADQISNSNNGLYVNDLWLAFDRPVTFGGMRFDPGDIAQCTDDPFDHRDPCRTVSKFFDASDAGLAGVKVDALEVGRRW